MALGSKQCTETTRLTATATNDWLFLFPVGGDYCVMGQWEATLTHNTCIACCLCSFLLRSICLAHRRSNSVQLPLLIYNHLSVCGMLGFVDYLSYKITLTFPKFLDFPIIPSRFKEYSNLYFWEFWGKLPELCYPYWWLRVTGWEWLTELGVLWCLSPTDSMTPAMHQSLHTLTYQLDWLAVWEWLAVWLVNETLQLVVVR